MAISDEEAEKAVDYLRDSADEAAQATAERHYIESWLKVVMSEEFSGSSLSTIAEREHFARQTERYKQAVEAERDAVRRDMQFRFRREAAQAKLAAWQTQSANERGARL